MQSKIKAIAVSILYILAGTASIITIASFFGNYGLYLELLSHLRLPIGIVLALLLLLVIIARAKLLVALLAMCSLLNAAPVLELYIADSNSGSLHYKGHLTVLQMNIRPYQNKNYKTAIEQINKHDADIVGIIELTKDWTDKLIETLPQYPYHFKEEGYGGIMLLSKYALIDPEIAYIGSIKRPRIKTSIIKEQKRLSIVLAHTVTPKNDLKLRNKELDLVAKEVKSASRPVIVFGDLNCSPFSPYFHRLLEKGNLKDTERGFGLESTWPAYWIPFVPIDHVLIGGDIGCEQRQVGPYIGSDHLPVFVKLTFPEVEQENK